MRVGIIGASGYVGGEALRLLLAHPEVEVTAATSERFKGKYVHRVHSNLRGLIDLQFVSHQSSIISDHCDFILVTAPHGASSTLVPKFLDIGFKVVDAGADFRLKDAASYERWYGWKHKSPELLDEAIYGLPELNREKIGRARLVATPGCMATSAILALAPLIKEGIIDMGKIVVDTKIGSSGSGTQPSLATHHAERYGVVRPYKPVGHRHTPEIEQELSKIAKRPVKISMSAHAVNIVRGILATCHTFTDMKLKPADLYKVYRGFYDGEPFIRIVREMRGIYRYPDPKLLVGSNFCDLGFEIDARTQRIVSLSALDNLVKGAAGSMIQCMNIMSNFDERCGLLQTGLHPV